MKGTGIFIAGCIVFNIGRAYSQENPLKLLTVSQRIDYVRQNRFPTAKTIFKDSAGLVLKGFNVLFPVVDGELYSGGDYYVNGTGQIVEVVVRKATAAEKELNKKLFDIEEDQLRGTMEVGKISCPQSRQLLEAVLKKDIENRNDEQVLDAELDNSNEATVMSVLSQCGIPTIENVGPDGLKAIYLVLLHARRKNQEKYLPLLEDFVKKGILRKGTLCAIEDRLLRTSGQKQRYGTQVVFFIRTGYELFPIEDRDHVDIRRAAVGLPTLEEYIRSREEYYGQEIKH